MAADAHENHRRMLAGELYYANTPELSAARSRCKQAIKRFNACEDSTRRRQVELWRDIVQDNRPLPPLLDDPEADAAQFSSTDPFVEPPLCMDYGTQVHIAGGTFINANSTWIDTCHIYIGERVLFAPNVSCYSGTHPLDPAVRDGLAGPEMGKEIHVEDDCWIGGNAIILPGVTVGRGSTVGAGSVVTKVGYVQTQLTKAAKMRFTERASLPCCGW